MLYLCRYTYWTLSYAVTRSGLKKLLAQDPIAKMLPVDEYLPIMFGAHTKYDNSTLICSSSVVNANKIKFIFS